jgi:pyruvate dehydrogenase (quinone)
MRVAVAERGVAVVVLPGDVAREPLMTPVAKWLLPATPIVRPTDEELTGLTGLLDLGESVTLFCGAGCAGAHDEVIELARKLKAPIVHSMRGKEYLEYDNPFDVGMTGLLGFASGYKAMMNCDTLLLLGTDFPYRQFFPEHARIAQIDIRAAALGNRCSLDIGVIGNVSDTLRALLPLIEEKADTDHLDGALADYRKARADLDALAESGPNSKIIYPQYVSRVVSALADENAIFSCDVGTPVAWAHAISG